MLIGILLCGHVTEAISEKYGEYDAMFRRLLKGRGLEFRTYSVVDMEFPDDPRDCEGWLITGSKHGAYDDLPFIRPLENFIRAVHGQKVPMVGICFGHQVVAQALGGTVEKFAGGWAVGRTEYDGTDGQFALNAWHQDQVTRPPAGARTTASNEFCAHAVLSYPGGLWTIQPHPEFARDVFGDFIRHRGEQAGVPEDILADARAHLAYPTDDVRFAERIARHFITHARVHHG